VAGWSPIQKIKDLVAFEWEVGIKHVYQEPNKCADVLANLGFVMGSGMTMYGEPPTPK
jgi:hypothetical protein